MMETGGRMAARSFLCQIAPLPRRNIRRLTTVLKMVAPGAE